jgi:hypothetical protein
MSDEQTDRDERAARAESAERAEREQRDVAVRVDSLLDALLGEQTPEARADALATLLNRAATRLHNLARSEATARKEQPDWPQWAQLQNAARSLVLQASTVRDLAKRLPPGPADPGPRP